MCLYLVDYKIMYVSPSQVLRSNAIRQYIGLNRKSRIKDVMTTMMMIIAMVDTRNEYYLLCPLNSSS